METENTKSTTGKIEMLDLVLDNGDDTTKLFVKLHEKGAFNKTGTATVVLSPENYVKSLSKPFVDEQQSIKIGAFVIQLTC